MPSVLLKLPDEIMLLILAGLTREDLTNLSMTNIFFSQFCKEPELMRQLPSPLNYSKIASNNFFKANDDTIVNLWHILNKLILTSSTTGQVKIWDLSQPNYNKPIADFRAHQKSLTNFLLIHKTTFLTTARDSTLNFWNSQNLKQVKKISSFKEVANVSACIMFSKEVLCVSYYDNSIKLFNISNLQSKHLLHSIDNQTTCTKLLVVNQHTLLCGNSNGWISCYNINNTQLELSSRFFLGDDQHHCVITSMIELNQGIIAVGLANKKIKVVDFNSSCQRHH